MQSPRKLILVVAIASLVALALLGTAQAQGLATGGVRPAGHAAVTSAPAGPSADLGAGQGAECRHPRPHPSPPPRPHPGPHPEPVPEPATMALIALGLGGLGLLSRRRRLA